MIRGNASPTAMSGRAYGCICRCRASRAAGDQILAKLKAGGIDDALEMPGPNEGSVISLGLYSEPKRAQARVAQAQALGFNPGIADRKRTGNVYWIDIDLKPTDSLLNPADLQGESGRIVRLEVKGCPSAVRSRRHDGPRCSIEAHRAPSAP